MGNTCGCQAVDAVEKDSRNEFNSLKSSNDTNKSISRDEFAGFVDKNAQLWSMLTVNLGLSEERSKNIASDVAFNLASTSPKSGKKSSKKGNKGASESLLVKEQLTKEEFHEFRKHFVLDPKGNLELFHRCVFAAYDTDKNGTLDRGEISKFLDIFYDQESIFKGDDRLPSKKKLTKIVFQKMDANKDGILSFEEIRVLISGKMHFSS